MLDQSLRVPTCIPDRRSHQNVVLANLDMAGGSIHRTQQQQQFKKIDGVRGGGYSMIGGRQLSSNHFLSPQDRVHISWTSVLKVGLRSCIVLQTLAYQYERYPY